MPYQDLTGLRFGSITVLSRNTLKTQEHKEQTGHSKAFWNCICDCGEKCIADTYTLKKHFNTLCPKCNFKSFEDWCIETHHEIWLDLWDYDLNGCSPDKVHYGTTKEYFFKCPNHRHPSTKISIDHLRRLTKPSYCTACNSIAQWGIDNIGSNFVNDYWSDKNTIDPWQLSKGTHRLVLIKCQNSPYHPDYLVSPVNFINHHSRCPLCSGYSGKVHPLDSLGTQFPDVIPLWSEQNKLSPYEFRAGSGKEVYWHCSLGIHPDFIRSINTSVKCNFRCPQCVSECSQSEMQTKVSIYIDELGYSQLHERDCTILPRNPKHKDSGRYDMPFDNEIPELKLIIEVHGQQHYFKHEFHRMQSKKSGTSADELFREQRLRDRYKSFIAHVNGYHYLAIPHWEFKDDHYKTLINNKVNEILLSQDTH